MANDSQSSGAAADYSETSSGDRYTGYSQVVGESNANQCVSYEGVTKGAPSGGGSAGVRSGASWVTQFPGSTSVDDLEPTFRGRVQAFLAALAAAAATVTVSATYRPPERAYLMHWAWLIVKQSYDPQQVPPMPGVNILWWHGDAASSLRGAQEMVDGFAIGGLGVAPALGSRHTQRQAIDMNISWSGTLSIHTADGSNSNITSNPKTGANADLIAVGATYGVIHFLTVDQDRPHWSNDGH